MKYDNEHAERIGEVFLTDYVSFDNGGSVEAPTGFFVAVDLDANSDDADERAAVEHYAERIIVREDDQGFVDIIPFEDRLKRDVAFQELDQAYALWDAGVTDGDIVTAITAYRACALWSSTNEDGVPFDALDAGLSEAAQRQMRDDVVEFITGDIENIRAFMDESGLDWAQVGHDFWLTRNHHGAGFWDRGFAGPAVDALVESCHAYGSVDLFVNDDGEIEVS